MKKIQFLFVLFFLSFYAMGRPPVAGEKNFTLKISFEEKVIIKEARLFGAEGDGISENMPVNILSGYINPYNVFTLSVSYVSTIDKKERNINLTLFIQPGESQLYFKKNTDQYVLNGPSSANHLVFKKMQKQDELLIKKIQATTAQLNQYKKTDNDVFIKKLKDSILVLENKRAEFLYGDFIRKNPNSIVSLYALHMYGYVKMESPLDVEKMVNTIADSLQQTAQVTALKVQIEKAKKIMVGQSAPVFSQTDTSGKIITLSDFQGQYVLIDFWASWCKPCRAQNPSLAKLYNQFRNKGFTILGVSLDSDKRSWVKAINDDQLGWFNISDLRSWKNEAAITYNISSVPQNYLLDKKGMIIAKNLNEEELIKKLNEVTSL
jgi:peroxiredoxin